MPVTSSIHLVPYLPQRHLGCKKLWTKVIIRAIYDYVLYSDSPNQYNRLHASSANVWLFSDHPLDSIHYACQYVDVPIDRIRNYARTVSKNKLRKLRLTDRNFDETDLQGILSELSDVDI